MPLYEYQCEGCGEVFELIQKFSDAPITVHEKCGGRVHRLLSAPALQFKGSGWYVTDYAKKSHTSASSDSGNKDKDKDKDTKESKKDDKKPESSSKETTRKADKHK